MTRCPRCKDSRFDGLVCLSCRMAWPSEEFVTPGAKKYAAAEARWAKWSRAKRTKTEQKTQRYLLGAD